jgi:ABC-type transporter Mla subunit MlaD
VGTVKTFVQDNRKALVTDIEKLTQLMKTINSERESIDTALNVAPVAINNLTLAYNQESGTIGSRIGIQGQLWDPDGFLCAIVQQSQMVQVTKDLACTIFEQLLEPVANNIPEIPTPGARQGGQESPARAGQVAARQAQAAELERAQQLQAQYVAEPSPTLTGLLGGAS